jgi:hypothetical protein
MADTTIENLNNRNIDIKCKFQNQKMSTLAMEFLKNEFSNLSLSNMNESGESEVIISLVVIILETVNLMDGLMNQNQKI